MPKSGPSIALDVPLVRWPKKTKPVCCAPPSWRGFSRFETASTPKRIANVVSAGPRCSDATGGDARARAPPVSTRGCGPSSLSPAWRGGDTARAWSAQERLRGAQRDQPRAGDGRQRAEGEHPLRGPPGRSRDQQRRRHAEHAADEEPEEMGHDVRLAVRAEHREERQAPGDGQPRAATPALAPELEAAEHADRAEDRGRRAHRAVMRAVEERVEDVAPCAGREHEPTADARPERPAHGGHEEDRKSVV